MNTIRAMIVDDSVKFRNATRNALQQLDLEVIGHASTRQSAIHLAAAAEPTVVILDVDMIGGKQVLVELANIIPSAAVVIFSFENDFDFEKSAGGLKVLDCLSKPQGNDLNEITAQLRVAFNVVFGAMIGLKEPDVEKTIRASAEATVRPEILVIGVSTGGPAALNQLLPQLPAHFPIPIVIVQHMPPTFTKSLAHDLDCVSSLNVCEAQHREPVQSGSVYIAPGGRQMKLSCYQNKTIIKISNDPPIKSCKPSVDYLFASAAECFGDRTLAVVLTGMGDDGTDGARAIRAAGGKVFAQSESSCVVYGMPRHIYEEGLANAMVSLDLMAETVIEAVDLERATCS